MSSAEAVLPGDAPVAVADEFALIAGRLGVDPFELIPLANRHPGMNILQPSPGVGGHCIAVDPWFVVHADPEQSRFIRAARETNLAKTQWVIDRVVEAVEAAGDDAGIACFGLAYKADVDDLRESPAVAIAMELARRYPGRVRVVEPFVEDLPGAAANAGLVLTDAASAVRDSHVLVGLTDHTEFKRMDRGVLEGKVVVDTRGMWG